MSEETSTAPVPKKRVAKKAAATPAKKAPAKKAAKKVPAKKAPAKKAAGAVKVLRAGDEGFDSRVSRRGREDLVSPDMDPILEALIGAGVTDTIQLPADDPFTVNQIRTWATKRKADTLPEGAKLTIGGGIEGRNIFITYNPGDGE